MRWIDPNGKVSLSLGYPRTNGDQPPTCNLEIRDYPSGQAIAMIEMTSDELVKLITSHHQALPAWVCPDDLRYRIGRKLVTKVVEVPREIISMTMSREARPERYAAAERWAMERLGDIPPWEVFELRRTNHNWECIFHRWDKIPVEAPDES